MATDTLKAAVAELRVLGKGSVQYDPNYATGIGLITIDNPERQNGFSGKMMAELYEIVFQLGQQDHEDMVALIVTGSRNKAFCAGLDLVFAREHMRTPRMIHHVNHLMHNTLSILAQLPLITVASMAGPALGGGTELLTAFDYICMASTAFLQFIQTRMGVSSPWGGAGRLVGRIGRKRALLILGSAPKIDANMATQAGLADVVVEVERGSLDAYDACLQGSVTFLRGFIFDERSNERVTAGAVRGMKKLVVRADVEQDEAFDSMVLNELGGLSKI